MFSYCAYQGCRNQNLPCSNTTFFTLPRDERRQIWITNSGNPEIQNLSEKTIKYFCEKHFDSKYIRRQFTRTTLHKSAVPYKYKEESYTHTLSYTNDENNDAYADSRFIIADNDISSNHSDEIPTSTGQYEIIIENIYEQNSTDENDKLTLNNDEHSKMPDVWEEKTEEIHNRRKRSCEYNREELKNKSNKFKKIEYSIENDSGKVENTSVAGFETALDANETEEIAENITSNENECVSLEGEINKILNESKVRNSKSSTSLTNKDTSSLNTQDNKMSRRELSNSDSYDEDKHFALSLVGYFQRLNHQKKALAKLKILQYLTELELNGIAEL